MDEQVQFDQAFEEFYTNDRSNEELQKVFWPVLNIVFKAGWEARKDCEK